MRKYVDPTCILGSGAVEVTTRNGIVPGSAGLAETHQLSPYEFIRVRTHLGGLELTKLKYTTLEDNLIRCRGDRLQYALSITSSIPKSNNAAFYPLRNKLCYYVPLSAKIKVLVSLP